MPAPFFVSPTLGEIESEFFSELVTDIPLNAEGHWDGFHLDDEGIDNEVNWADWKARLIKKHGK